MKQPLALGVCLLSGTVAAQSLPDQRRLMTPTVAVSTAMLADWATTYYALKNFRLREANPLLRPFDREPGKLVVIGAAMDIGLVTAWNYSVGKDHPRMAVAGLWAMTAFRGYLALHNMRNVQRTARRLDRRRVRLQARLVETLRLRGV